MNTNTANTTNAMAARATVPIIYISRALESRSVSNEKGRRMKRSLYPRSFGRRVRILREDMRLSQPELVKMVNDQKVELTQSYLSKLENVKPEDGFKAPAGEVVGAIAKALQTTSDFLLCLIDDPDVASGGSDEAGVSMEASKAADLVDHLSPESRQEALRVLQAMFDAEAARRAYNTRQWQRLLETVGKMAGPEVRAQIEQSILASSIEVAGDSMPS